MMKPEEFDFEEATELNPNTVRNFPYHKGVAAYLYQGRVFVLCEPDVGEQYVVDFGPATGEEEEYV